MKQLMIVFVVIAACMLGYAEQDPTQKTLLTDVFGYQGPGLPMGSQPRFEVPQDLVWPAAHGDADVCLWADDKFAAISLGVDDNNRGDHAWWLEMADKYNFKMTWWVVTQCVEDECNVSQMGTWDDFRALYAAGHELASHSADHEPDPDPANPYGCYDGDNDYWDEQMQRSNDQLRTAVPGCEPKTFAGPCGKGPDAYVTARHYIAFRGVVGAINGAATTTYHKLATVTTSSLPFKTDYILNPDATEYFAKYRGWWVWFTHGTGDKVALENNMLVPLTAKRDSIWIGRFDHVAQYGQSRDTHTLTVASVTDDVIRFTLTDSMCDSLFDYPLTVKVRVNNDWDGCGAVQDGAVMDADIVKHGGNKYVLVKAVPDRGEVVLTRGTALVRTDTPVITPDGGSAACSVLVRINCADAADIYFTTDGGTPDSATAMRYAGPFCVRDDAVVKAVAYGGGAVLPSLVASALFTVATVVADVVISPTCGSYDDTVGVMLSCGTAGAVIRYTLDGNDPDETDAEYVGGIILTDNATVKAKAFHGCLAACPVAAAAYDIDIPSGVTVRRWEPVPEASGSVAGPVFYDCRGRASRTVPAGVGVYFVHYGGFVRKTVILE